MARPIATKTGEHPESFDVTVQSVIGTVNMDDRLGSHPTAVHAAFSIVADWVTENAKGTQLASGRFSFPDPYGGNETVITVEA